MEPVGIETKTGVGEVGAYQYKVAQLKKSGAPIDAAVIPPGIDLAADGGITQV